MSGDNSWASVEGRYYRAVLGVSEPICEVGLHSHLYKYLGREAFAHPHTFSFLHQWSLQWAFYTRGTCCSCNFELWVISNCSAFVGICPLSFHCWGDGVGTGVLSAGETQWQVYKHTCNSFGGGWKQPFSWLIYTFSDLQVPKEAGADLLCFSKPGWDEWRGRSAVQLAAHTEEAHPERRLRGEHQLINRRWLIPLLFLLRSSHGFK